MAAHSTRLSVCFCTRRAGRETAVNLAQLCLQTRPAQPTQQPHLGGELGHVELHREGVLVVADPRLGRHLLASRHAALLVLTGEITGQLSVCGGTACTGRPARRLAVTAATHQHSPLFAIGLRGRQAYLPVLRTCRCRLPFKIFPGR